MRARKNSEERVIVARRNRIELVIVAAGAACRYTQERGTQIVHGVGEIARPSTDTNGVGYIACSHDMAPMFGLRLPRQQIARQLLADELVVRRIVVERLNHVVAILVSLGNREVALAAIGVGIADDVEPLAAPTLAVRFRSEKAVDQ